MSQNVYDTCLPMHSKSNGLAFISRDEYFQQLRYHRRMFLLMDIFHKKVSLPTQFLNTGGFPQLSLASTCQPSLTHLRREDDLRKCEFCYYRVR